VDRYYITIAALKALADESAIATPIVTEAIKNYGLDPEKPAPWEI
jgi:pyruvate dehydrogenase E1 component